MAGFADKFGYDEELGTFRSPCSGYDALEDGAVAAAF